MEGAFDPAVWRREALVSAIVVAVAGLVALFAFTSLLALAGVAILIAVFIAWALLEYRDACHRSWALTRRALYISDGPPLPLSEIGRMKGTSNHVRLRRRGGGRLLLLLGEPRAIELRQRLRDLRAEGSA